MEGPIFHWGQLDKRDID